MFQSNQRHLQAPLLSDLDYLSDKARARLDESWAGAFYQEFFRRLDEQPFAVLYSDAPSRPNIPINVLVGLEALKSGFDWSDEEMHDAFLFDVQVRYALGYRNLGEGDFDLRTVYNFRRRLREHMRETGENLIERAFVQITDEQIAAFQLKTGRLRMDSTQIASNIEQMGRLQLLVEVLQRVHRMLNAADQVHYADTFAPYLRGSSGQYVYHLKRQDTAPHLQRIGALMHRLLIELTPTYANDATYQILQRVFDEQFILEDQASPVTDEDERGPKSGSGQSGQGHESSAAEPQPADDPSGHTLATVNTSPIQVRPGKEISPRSLRSPDDPEATYRKKGSQAYEGYVANVTETCDPDNPFQLIVKVQTAPNVTEDTTLLLEAAPELKARLDVYTLYNDGGFCGPDVDKLLDELEIEQVPTALRGRAPDPNRTSLADFDIQRNDNGRPVKLVCPHGYTAIVTPGRKEGRFIAYWADTACPECLFSQHHTGRKPSTKTCFRFSQKDLYRALRRQRLQGYYQHEQRLRAAVEATVGALKRPFDNDKAPVRGRIRLDQMMLGSAIMVNIRRIQRYKLEKRKKKQSQQSQDFRLDKEQKRSHRPVPSFLLNTWLRLQRRLSSLRPVRATLVFGF